MELDLQKFANSCLNWGPPSVLMDLGQPKELTILASLAVIFAVCVLVRCVSYMYPEYRSTVASQFLHIAPNRSVPISSIGVLLNWGQCHWLVVWVALVHLLGIKSTQLWPALCHSSYTPSIIADAPSHMFCLCLTVLGVVRQ